MVAGFGVPWASPRPEVHAVGHRAKEQHCRCRRLFAYSTTLQPIQQPQRLLLQDFYASHKTQVEESKPYIEQYGTQRLPKYMQYFEDVLEHSGGDYLLGDQLTVADLAVYQMLAAAQQHYRWVAQPAETPPRMPRRIEYGGPRASVGPAVCGESPREFPDCACLLDARCLHATPSQRGVAAWPETCRPCKRACMTATAWLAA